MKIHTKIFVSRPKKDTIPLPIDEVMGNFAKYVDYLRMYSYKEWGNLYIEYSNQRLLMPIEMPMVFFQAIPNIFTTWQNTPNQINKYTIESQQHDGNTLTLLETTPQEKIKLSFEVVYPLEELGRVNQEIVVDYWWFFEQAFLNMEQWIAYYRCFTPYEGEEVRHATHHENALNAARKLYAQKCAAYKITKGIASLKDKQKNGALLLREQVQLDYLQKINAADTEIALNSLLAELQTLTNIDNDTRKYLIRQVETKIKGL